MNPTSPRSAGEAPDSIPPHVKSNYVDCIRMAARAPRQPSPPPLTPPVEDAR
ncbi:hypothetical protein KZZ52_39385 [Dactylosporangium sp. AC04546]|uniref:hypothetical protein n=1 Tax=Dactylosporangium sp. AC04546 TaxID=2862460 RepID=UPI001EDCA096|nr:hypothetical protein [Dactylosporangium sp. AC04546]WVK80014.1 hypothetical protein KZZ52_39385 [Dactylosporangium sp. AC04546]